MAMGYDCLIYELDSYYIAALVHEFWDGFTKFDIVRDNTNFTLKWRRCTINIHVGAISVVTGIVLSNAN